MNLEDMSKEELILQIKELKKQVDFSHEDRLKLAILKKAPFTIWASDRNCIIKMWSGRCEAMYGLSEDEVLGKDFVPLFVAKDEQLAARRDQLKIIDDNAIFHNIANDNSQNGNILHLITNCFRIRDPESGEYWSAEIGISMDHYEAEKKQLEKNIAESRLIHSIIDNFRSSKNQMLEQLYDRRKNLMQEIDKSITAAINSGIKHDYQSIRKNYVDEINYIIEGMFKKVFEEHLNLIQSCTTQFDCQEIRSQFNFEYQNILEEFYSIVTKFHMEFVDINSNSSITLLKDRIMKETSSKNLSLSYTAQLICNKAEQNLIEYEKLGPIVDKSSIRYKNLKALSDEACSIKNEIVSFVEQIYSELLIKETEDELKFIQQEMYNGYGEIEKRLQKIKKKVYIN